MVYPSLLLLLENDLAAPRRLALACGLARRFEGHLTGLSCRRHTPWKAGGFADVLGADPLTTELREFEQAAWYREELFERQCSAAGVAFDLMMDDGERLSAVLRRAATADLVIAGRPDPHDDAHASRRELLENLLLQSARPVLVLPPDAGTPELGQRIVVAWDGSHGASRAALDALPLLRRAAGVHLLRVERPGEDDAADADESLDRASIWLRRHGVRAEPAIALDAGPVGDVLATRAVEFGADLLVMGAFGRPRAVERVLGGATRGVLEAATLPVLFSH